MYQIYFELVIKDNEINGLQFKAYENLKLKAHPLFPKYIVRSWSQVDAVLHYYTGAVDPNLTTQNDKQFDLSPHQKFLRRQICLINTPKNNTVYSSDDLIMAFSWYVRSRALYEELRKSIRLPSLSTLRKITRMAKNTEDEILFSNIFKNQPERCRGCIVLIDEVYVKSSLTYCGGVVFGYAEDDSSKKATTLLTIMVKCLFGGEIFIAKIIPCHALTAEFQYQCVKKVIHLLEHCGATVIGLINDNNRINQSFFRLFTPFNPLSPWIVRSVSNPSQPMFLLYDPVHILKNIRNNWLSEKTETLRFMDNTGNEKVAKWSHLRDLLRHETTTCNGVFKLSNLKSTSINPSNVEKQKVCLVLDVFSEKTSAALKTSSISLPEWKETAEFIDKVLQLWKLLNCKSPAQSIRLNDPDRVALRSSDSHPNKILNDWANLAGLMAPPGSVRIQSLTSDTSKALQWTCKCLLDLTHYLLNVPSQIKHDFVCLGFFQQDDLERYFGYLRMAAGCNYYITVQDVFSTQSIDRAKLLLDNCPELDHNNDHHVCDICQRDLTDSELLLLDDLSDPDYIENIPSDEKAAIFYVAGYVSSKHQHLARGETSTTLSEEITAFFRTVDRGRLCCPSDAFLGFVLLAYSFFIKSDARQCRNRFVSTISQFSDIFHLNIVVPKAALMRITNIFMKRFVDQDTHDRRDNRRKIIKLASQSQATSS